MLASSTSVTTGSLNGLDFSNAALDTYATLSCAALTAKIALRQGLLRSQNCRSLVVGSIVRQKCSTNYSYLTLAGSNTISTTSACPVLFDETCWYVGLKVRPPV